MAMTDKIKEQIGWLKVTFALSVAINASLIGWLVQNFNQINNLLLITTVATAALLSITMIIISHLAYHKMNDLEDL